MATNEKRQAIQQAIHEDDVYGWEQSFGVDNPDYLPYWVAYMPHHQRQLYLSSCNYQFKDYEPAMLDSSFDWETWSPTIDN